MREMNFDIVIIGGGTGGCAAALAAAKMGKSVVLTEETEWIGGQFTSQAVPSDEHRWIEQFGCTASYRKFRQSLRDYYRGHFPLRQEVASDERLNPGNAIVSGLSVEPRVALAVFHEKLAPYVHNGLVTIMTRHVPVKAETDGDKVVSVMVRNTQSNETVILLAPYFLDATECGDLLPLAGVEYVSGAESQLQTGEPNALAGDPKPLDMQSFTYCFALDYTEGEDHTIEKPRDYGFWRQYKADFWPGEHLSWSAPKHSPMKGYSLFERQGYFSLWNYRRIVDKSLFKPGTFDSDVTLVNWPQNDYWLGPIIDVPEVERLRNLDAAKQLSFSLLYWLQNEAPRPDGRLGYPGLRLRKDVVGTEDGMAMAPYIRESRRIQAQFTVLEQHLSPAVRGKQGAETFSDSVGIGSYRMDLHPTSGGRPGLYNSCYPFQIPLGSLMPIRVRNLLPACKNIGVTHITNGCYRLHPVEWNIGETAGYLAAFCLQRGLEPAQVRSDITKLGEFQVFLSREGIELSWPITQIV